MVGPITCKVGIMVVPKLLKLTRPLSLSRDLIGAVQTPPAIIKENAKTGISKRYGEVLKVWGAGLYH